MQPYAAVFGVHALGRDQITKTSKLVERKDVATYTTAGAVTYTAADILGGIIMRDCNGAGRTDVLPSAALLLAAMKDEEVGDIIPVLIINNTAAGGFIITITPGAGGTLAQVATSTTVPGNTSRLVFIRITGAATYDVFM